MEEVCFFLNQRPCGNNREPIDKNSFPSDSFRKVFVELNTPVPSSAVERVFSTGEDILKPKRLKDEHFEQLILLKLNKRITK
jgi:hypothetical protein